MSTERNSGGFAAKSNGRGDLKGDRTRNGILTDLKERWQERRTVTQAQAIIREASPGFLAENPPIGITESLAYITKELSKPKFVEFRQPFCRKPDPQDDLQSCYVCGGDQTVLVDDHEEDCAMCGGSGTLPFMENEIFLTVWRDSHSIETLAVVLENGDVNAFVSCSQPGFPEGQRVLLTEHEQEAARNFLTENSEPHKAGNPTGQN